MHLIVIMKYKEKMLVFKCNIYPIRRITRQKTEKIYIKINNKYHKDQYVTIFTQKIKKQS